MDFRSILGTSNKRRLLLLEQLYHRRDGLSSDQLLSTLNCSLPILLNDIDLINGEHPSFQVVKMMITACAYPLQQDGPVWRTGDQLHHRFGTAAVRTNATAGRWTPSRED